MLFFHVSNCCSHHRNVIWSPRGGEVVCKTICLLEVIYKVKKKLGICPLVTSLLSMQKKTGRAFADLLLPLLSPNMPHKHMYQHTRAHPHPLLQLGTEPLFMLEEGTSGEKAAERHHHDKPDLGTAHSALPSPWGEGILRETASVAILLPGSLHRFPWNLSLALSCSWLLYTIVETPELWSPFPRGKLYGPQEGAKSLRRFWGSIPCRYPQQDKAPCCCHSSCSQLQNQ